MPPSISPVVFSVFALVFELAAFLTFAVKHGIGTPADALVGAALFAAVVSSLVLLVAVLPDADEPTGSSTVTNCAPGPTTMDVASLEAALQQHRRYAESVSGAMPDIKTQTPHQDAA